MTMTSDQIRKALAPLKDFAPAILATAEIADLESQRDALRRTIRDLPAQVEELKREKQAPGGRGCLQILSRDRHHFIEDRGLRGQAAQGQSRQGLDQLRACLSTAWL